MEERIQTLHPQGKQGVHILLRKYNTIKDYILTKLAQEGPMTYGQLSADANRDLSSIFDGKVPWYVVSVKLDLEARGIIRRIPKTSPHQIELVKS